MYCLTCGYDLRNLSHATCPECGRAFDAAMSSSYATGMQPLVPKGRAWFGLSVSIVCALVFFSNDPWDVNDGWWMGMLLEEWPPYVLTVGGAIYAMSVPRSPRWFYWLCIALLILFFAQPLTQRYTERVFTQILPAAFEGP